MNIRLFLSFLLFTISVVPSFGQTDKEKAENFLSLADEILKETKAFYQAKEMYILAAKADPANIRANFQAGKAILETVNKDQCTPYFLKVNELNPNYRFDIFYLIGRGYQYGLDFEKAIEYFDKYKKKLAANKSYRGADKVYSEEVERRMIECYNGMELVASPTNSSIEHIGDGVNSEWPDYGPNINEDETIMIFTSRRQEDNTSENVDIDNFYFEDIYISYKENGVWGKAKNIGKPINTQYHDANVGFSADGKQIYLYKDKNMGDVYVSSLQDNNIWSKPEPVSSRINSINFAEKAFSLSKDQKTVFFSSNRPGGYGGFDLYMCVKNDRGEWGRTTNLGPVINTNFDEDSPFIDYDGKTLYFSSKGHKGYGGYDIFYSTFDSTSMQWSIPINLGYPINTPDDEIHFVATKEGNRGYFASVREEGRGYTDIYMVNFHGVPKETSRKITLNKIKGEKLKVDKELDRTNKIYFELNGSGIAAEDIKVLEKYVEALKKFGNLGVEISGFASTDGNPKYNLDLSIRRATEVWKYFINNGIPTERIVSKGYGSLKGESPNAARRVEVKFFDLDFSNQ
jgi:outer membrane protein OmpA-like peptidoglycan-associated protein/tetratricopeptide (TPR) repeat protein